MNVENQGTWHLWIDTGGTFTDCSARDPAGKMRRVKVLSSSALRGSVTAISGTRVGFRMPFELPENFAAGAHFRLLGKEKLGSLEVVSSDGQTFRLGEKAASLKPGDVFELVFDQEAPVLAARLVTGTARVEELPPLHVRLATTRGTNALLERRGARTVLLVTKGFRDLLRIGEQHRPELFARQIRRPEPIYDAVVEVDERLDAEGRVIRPLDPDPLRETLRDLRDRGFEAAAVALLHAYVNDRHEGEVAKLAAEAGFAYVSAAARLTPTLKILPRARTAVVDAYLSPVVGRYLDRVASAVGKERLRVMTSAGGLMDAKSYRAKDSLLSGPAAGVVGAARAGREHGRARVVAFDMGGTSTDVSRFDGDYEYRFTQRVGDVDLAAPALAIETVAAGGGSLCRLDRGVPKVGPESAGAFPGPACYGAGGPLTITDVHLLLGRLDADRFEIPVDPAAAERAVDRQRPDALSREELLLGYLAVADQRMADAVRGISVRRGYDPADYSLVAFGGAGGLHGCELAGELGMTEVIWPREAGVLSAFGLGAAVVERLAESQVSKPLQALDGADLEKRLHGLAERATADLRKLPEIDPETLRVRRRSAFLRLEGQESTLEVSVDGSVEKLQADYFRLYGERYGYRPVDRALELESLRVTVSAPPLTSVRETVRRGEGPSARPSGRRPVCFAGRWVETPVFEVEELAAGSRIRGPALVFDRHASFVVPSRWEAVSGEAGLVARRRGDPDDVS